MLATGHRSSGKAGARRRDREREGTVRTMGSSAGSRRLRLEPRNGKCEMRSVDHLDSVWRMV